MCLSNVKIIYEKPYKDTGKNGKIGYKVVRRKRNAWTGPSYDSNTYKYDQWITDTNKKKIGWYDAMKHSSGFHVFTTLKGARFYKDFHSGRTFSIKKVRYQDVTAEGEQLGYKAVVARKIMVLKENIE